MRSPPGALCEIQKRHREYHRTRSSQALTRGFRRCSMAVERPGQTFRSPKLQKGNARLKRKSLLTSKHARTLLALRSRTLRYQSGGALRALAMYRKSTGRRDRLSIDLGTESMPELGPGTKRRASVMRAPPWSAVFWAAPSRAGPRHSRTGLRSPSRQ